MRRSLQLCLAAGLLALPDIAAAQVAAAPEEVIAPPEDEIFVRGGPFPRCHPRPGDPLDQVNVSNPGGIQQVILLGKDGRYHLERDTDPIGGPGVWQRAGKSIDAFTFRVPLDGSPMCIGRRTTGPGHGQLRIIVDATPLRGKFIRFTAWVAMKPSTHTRAWVAAGLPGRYHILTGDIESQPMTGTGRWEPMSITIGPVEPRAGYVSYGFLLQGKGDLWIMRPEIEVLDRRPEDVRALRRQR